MRIQCIAFYLRWCSRQCPPARVCQTRFWSSRGQYMSVACPVQHGLGEAGTPASLAAGLFARAKSFAPELMPLLIA